jgi:hypothetical protein
MSLSQAPMKPMGLSYNISGAFRCPKFNRARKVWRNSSKSSTQIKTAQRYIMEAGSFAKKKQLKKLALRRYHQIFNMT